MGLLPKWFNQPRRRTEIKWLDWSQCEFLIGHAETELLVDSYPHTGSDDYWTVIWKMNDGIEGHSGTVSMDNETLACAFKLNDYFNPDDFINWSSEHEAKFAKKGKFIRTGRYLSIPGPRSDDNLGTSVSLIISDEISRAIEKFIGYSKSRLEKRRAN